MEVMDVKLLSNKKFLSLLEEKMEIQESEKISIGKSYLLILINLLF